ncbi:VOC family protein [Nocardioides sp. URHA0032]|uniref:VOC family protein n=1 Tax=Nocardioides sp. URHA0032 TaxID=1380388 RepID=UPI000AD1BE35|nr:VOC family protein [Nocardioides sp. URHA0032]
MITVRRFWHVGINVTDMDATIEFYEKIGFEVVQDKEVDDANLARAFMFDGASKLRFAHMRLPNDSADEALLDLIQWHDERAAGRSQTDLIHPGLCRFSILTDDIQGEYDRLSATGVKFLSEPQAVMDADGTTGWKLLFAEDPDGTLFHFVELVGADTVD